VAEGGRLEASPRHARNHDLSHQDHAAIRDQAAQLITDVTTHTWCDCARCQGLIASILAVLREVAR
jgi:hypothetical protein